MADEGVPTQRRIQIDVALQVSLGNRNPGEDDGDAFGIGDLLSAPVDPAAAIRSSTGRHGSQAYGS